MDIVELTHSSCDKEDLVLLIKKHFDEHVAMYCLISTFQDVSISTSCDEASITYTIEASDHQKDEIIKSFNRAVFSVYNKKFNTEVDIHEKVLKIKLIESC